jgi:hypothetical protein
MKTKKSIAIICVLIADLLLASCGGSSSAIPAGTIKGQIKFSNPTSSTSIHPCLISAYSDGTPVDAASVDWSGLSSNGWSASEGFNWQGDVRAPGFACTVNPKPKYEFSGRLDSESENAFSILDVPAGRYALVVVYNRGMNDAAGLVFGANGVPLVIELTSDHGIDTGSLSMDNNK